MKRLKEHSEKMIKDQQNLNSEVDALDKHLVNLNNQNCALQKKLDEFMETDEIIKINLDRR
jgi:hypothetical protein